VSLQKDGGASAIEALGLTDRIFDATADLGDFADTAALCAHLDLVIAVDTAVAHLAGALGRPVYLLLPQVPDFRWLLERSDSPWYPRHRLFRQRRAGDWRDPVAAIAAELPRFLAEIRDSGTSAARPQI
jgi:ADP-heptose:LPS heptosyltransferase